MLGRFLVHMYVCLFAYLILPLDTTDRHARLPLRTNENVLVGPMNARTFVAPGNSLRVRKRGNTRGLKTYIYKQIDSVAIIVAACHLVVHVRNVW